LPPRRSAPLRGSDVLGLGVPPGPLVGELLREAEAVLEDSCSGPWPRERALAVLRELVAARIKTDR